MYLIGVITREVYQNTIFNTSDNKAMSDCFITDQLKQSHLVEAKKNNDYQIIDMSKLTYFDPIKNRWEAIDIK